MTCLSDGIVWKIFDSQDTYGQFQFQFRLFLSLYQSFSVVNNSTGVCEAQFHLCSTLATSKWYKIGLSSTFVGMRLIFLPMILFSQMLAWLTDGERLRAKVNRITRTIINFSSFVFTILSFPYPERTSFFTKISSTWLKFLNLICILAFKLVNLHCVAKSWFT